MIALVALAHRSDASATGQFLDRWVAGHVQGQAVIPPDGVPPGRWLAWSYNPHTETGPCAAMLCRTSDDALLVGLEIAGVEVPQCETEELILMENLSGLLKTLADSVGSQTAAIYFDDALPLTRSEFVRDARYLPA